jgi:hypothetical protein
MTAQRPPRTPDQPGSAQRTQYLVEICFGYILSGGDLLAVNGTAPRPKGEFKQRPDAVVRAT